jgi:hypothetical protein
MASEIEDCVARASLDNLVLPGVEQLIFSGFLIKRSPNCMHKVQIIGDDGKEHVFSDYPNEDELVQGFPECDYYLEIELGKTKFGDFNKAQEKLMWALNRLRLFKPGLLWGECAGIFDLKDQSNGCYLLTRNHREGPYPTGLDEDPFKFKIGYGGLYDVKDEDMDSIVNFVDSFKDTPKDQFSVALRRFHLYFDRDLIQDRAIDLMIILESLFSDSSEAIAHKIALRASYLIEPIAQNREVLFDFIKNAYKERSSIVHGKGHGSWFEQKSFSPTETNVESLEEIVRKSLLILLNKANQGIILKPEDMDSHLLFV